MKKAFIVLFDYKKEHILMLSKNKDNPFEISNWELPGGKVEKNESLSSGAFREFNEEVFDGRLFTADILHVHSNLIGALKGQNILYFVYIAKDDFPMREIRISHEHEKWEWISIHDMDLSIDTDMKYIEENNLNDYQYEKGRTLFINPAVARTIIFGLECIGYTGEIIDEMNKIAKYQGMRKYNIQ